MKKSTKTIIQVVAFALLFIIIWGGYTDQSNKAREFTALQLKVANYANSTSERIAKGVVTLPDDNLVVGLENNKGIYEFSGTKTTGIVTIYDKYLTTKFVEGVNGGQAPRLDAIVPMHVSLDSQGDSMYIVLFNDRGDAVIEKSYARIGNRTAIVQSITALPADENIKGEEYKVSVVYKLEGRAKDSDMIVSIPKEVIIPVVDGHFDPDRTVSRN